MNERAIVEAFRKWVREHRGQLYFSLVDTESFGKTARIELLDHRVAQDQSDWQSDQ